MSHKTLLKRNTYRPLPPGDLQLYVTVSCR